MTLGLIEHVAIIFKRHDASLGKTIKSAALHCSHLNLINIAEAQLNMELHYFLPSLCF